MCKIKNLFAACIALFFACSTTAQADVNQNLINKVSFGRAADVELLLKQKADPSSTNAAGISALFLAASRADDDAPKIVEALIKAGADIYRPDYAGNLPIVEAVKRGHPLSVRIIVMNRSLMTVTDSRGVDLLTLARQRGNHEIISYVKAGIEAEQKQLATLKSDENLHKLVKDYARLSCQEYYYIYFKKENPDKMGDEKYKQLMDKNKEDSEFTRNRLSSLFDLSKADIAAIATSSKQAVEDKLGSLLTKENRLYNGFGTKSNLDNMCTGIAERWNGKRIARKQTGNTAQ